MRTRTSFELGAFRAGGHAIVLQPGKDAWPIEFDLGTVMDNDTGNTSPKWRGYWRAMWI